MTLYINNEMYFNRDNRLYYMAYKTEKPTILLILKDINTYNKKVMNN